MLPDTLSDIWYDMLQSTAIVSLVSTVIVITINEPVDYMARAVMILMWGEDITRAIGRGRS